jgi:hypothetical protein
MLEELERYIGTRTDEDLYEILFIHREDRTPEALAIAEQEWTRRALTPDRLTVVQAIGEERKRQREAIKDEPLSTAPRVFFFVFNFAFSLGLFQFLIAHMLYKSNGYERKFKDCFKWMMYGSLCFGAVYLILHWISLALSRG